MSTAALTLLGAQLAVGAAAIFARFALLGTGPLTASFFRLAIAAGIAAGIAFSGTRSRFSRRDEAAFALAGLALAAHFAAWISSLRYTSVGIATLLVCTTPLWLGLFDRLALRRYVGRAFWTGLGLAAVGLVLISSSNSVPAPVPGRAPLGLALALAGSVLIGVYMVIVRERGAAYRTRDIVARTYGWAALALLFALPVSGEPLPVTGIAWFGILGMALISQSLGHTGVNFALRTFTPRIVATATLAEPVIAGVLALFIFGERIGAIQVVGSALVLAAIAIVLRAEPGPPAPVAAEAAAAA